MNVTETQNATIGGVQFIFRLDRGYWRITSVTNGKETAHGKMYVTLDDAMWYAAKLVREHPDWIK